MTATSIAMRVLGWLRCLILPHEPNRRRVRKMRGGQHLGYCLHCGGQIRRASYNHWVRDRVRRGHYDPNYYGEDRVRPPAGAAPIIHEQTGD